MTTLSQVLSKIKTAGAQEIGGNSMKTPQQKVGFKCRQDGLWLIKVVYSISSAASKPMVKLLREHLPSTNRY